MSEPGRDPREGDDTISAAQGISRIETMIRNKLQERNRLAEQLLRLDAEIEGLRSAQSEIDKLVAVKRAARST